MVADITIILMFLNKVIYYGRLNVANVLLLFHFLSILRLTMSF